VGASSPIARLRLATIAVPVLAAAYAVAVPAAVDVAGEPPTSYAGVSAVAHAADLAAGIAVLLVGVAAWLEPRTRWLGGIGILVGATWFLPDWEGWDGAPSLLRTLAAALGPLLLAFVFHLVAAFPRGRTRSRMMIAAVVGVYGVATIVSIGRAALADPLTEGSCWRYCLGNPIVVHRAPGLTGALDTVWLWTAVAVGAAVAVTATQRLVHASKAERRRSGPAVAVGASESVYAIALLRTPLEDPRTRAFATIFVLRSLSLVALAAGLGSTVMSAHRTRAAIERLGRALDETPAPGRLAETLAAATGDRTLDVTYWLPDTRRYVHADGSPSPSPTAGEGRAVTHIARSGRPIAAVVHDAALVDGARLDAELAPGARLALENERLQAETLAELQRLRESRTRIVAARDRERRRLERDLHDGAQQRLLALSYDLRLARAAAVQSGDRQVAARLESAQQEADAAIAHLRELAHGIYPAILAEAGLASALETLADSAALSVELEHVDESRYSTAVETAAYVTVAAAIEDATARGATFVTASVSRARDHLVVETDDDGDRRSSDLVHVCDRVGALGGAVDVSTTALRAAIPCA
jgi:signal transduction histidine kinase